jgi:hypothetical protein
MPFRKPLALPVEHVLPYLLVVAIVAFFLWRISFAANTMVQEALSARNKELFFQCLANYI